MTVLDPDDGHGPIARVRMRKTMTNNIAELYAYTRLFAFAPVLLEALEELQNKAAIVLNKARDGRGVEPEDWSDLYAREQDARLALAKAKGEIHA